MSHDKNNQHTWPVTKRKNVNEANRRLKSENEKNNLKNVLTEHKLTDVCIQTHPAHQKERQNKTNGKKKNIRNHSDFHTR